MKKNLHNSRIIIILIVILGLILPVTAQAKEQVVLKNWLPNWPDCVEIWRMLSPQLEKIGIEVELTSGTIGQWVGEIVGEENTYHTVLMSWGGGPDRLEPSFFLTELLHSSRANPGGRNYGYYINKEYDEIVDKQSREMNFKKRQEIIRKAQEVIAKDNPIFPIFHRDYLQAYNIERIKGAIPVIGSGVGFPYIPWTFYKAEPIGDNKTPRIANYHDITTLNPFASADVETDGWLRLTYDTFAKRDQNGKLIPWAAESWKIIDETTIDIILRDGMKFHDDKPVTIEDVKFTFEYIMKWKFPSLSRVWKNVKSVKLFGKQGVRFELLQPYSPFIANVLGHVFIVPKHIWEKVPKSADVKNPIDWKNSNPIGSGPYQLVEWNKGEYFQFKANKNHFIAPNFDGLYCIITPTIEGLMALLEKGGAEILGWFVDAKMADKLDSMPHLKKVAVPNHGFHEMRPNFKLKPMNDPEFRKAFQHLINRKEMLDVIFGGSGTVCRNTPITPMLKIWNNPNIQVIEFNPTKAKEILKRAGYSWDKKGRLLYP